MNDFEEQAETSSAPTILWEDVTSFKQGDKERKSTAWAARVRGLRITVISGHIYNRDQWVLRCAPWFLETDMKMPAAEFSAAQAQRRALEMVREMVGLVAEDLAGDGE